MWDSSTYKQFVSNKSFEQNVSNKMFRTKISNQMFRTKKFANFFVIETRVKCNWFCPTFIRSALHRPNAIVFKFCRHSEAKIYQEIGGKGLRHFFCLQNLTTTWRASGHRFYVLCSKGNRQIFFFPGANLTITSYDARVVKTCDKK
jgi:hypothetical protein